MDIRDVSTRGYLLDQLNTGSQVHSEVNKLPDDTLFLILLLLEDKHVVIEELLQFLIGEVDTQLLETVILKNETKRAIFCYWTETWKLTE